MIYPSSFIQLCAKKRFELSPLGYWKYLAATLTDVEFRTYAESKEGLEHKREAFKDNKKVQLEALEKIYRIERKQAQEFYDSCVTALEQDGCSREQAIDQSEKELQSMGLVPPHWNTCFTCITCGPVVISDKHEACPWCDTWLGNYERQYESRAR